MNLTNEQIQAILDGAPGEKLELSHVDSLGFYHINDGHDLTDLREILELRQEVERLKGEQGKYPMQPIIKDKHNRDRFEANPIIDYIATEICDLNKVAIWCIENGIDNKYQEQLAQLIGYSVDGYGDLSYVSDGSCERANQLREQGDEL